MNRPDVRRKDRLICADDCESLLARCEYGVMATVDSQNRPYGVPLSYIWLNGLVYFHSAPQGHKIDNIRANSAVSFTVIGHTQPVYAKNFTTYYESVVLFGTVFEVSDPDEKYAALYALAEKYLPDHLDKAEKDIRHSFARTAVYAILPEQSTGKAKRPRVEDASGGQRG